LLNFTDEDETALLNRIICAVCGSAPFCTLSLFTSETGLLNFTDEDDNALLNRIIAAVRQCAIPHTVFEKDAFRYKNKLFSNKYTCIDVKICLFFQAAVSLSEARFFCVFSEI
jgi:hypothetical protein